MDTVEKKNGKDTVVLCAANHYTRKYYLNPAFNKLPETVRNELEIACVVFTEQAGGELQIVFDDEGEMLLQTFGSEDDFNYDEIGAALMIKELQKEKRELFQELTLFYKVVFLGESID